MSRSNVTAPLSKAGASFRRPITSDQRLLLQTTGYATPLGG